MAVDQSKLLELRAKAAAERAQREALQVRPIGDLLEGVFPAPRPTGGIGAPELTPDQQRMAHCGVPKLYWGARLEHFPGMQWPSAPSNVFLTGPTGTGKTYAACALLFAWEQKIARVGYTSAKKLANDFRACFVGKGESENDVLDHYCRWFWLLVIDDLGAENRTDGSIANLYTLLQERLNKGLLTIVTSNLTLEEINKELDARMASRLGAFAYYKLAGDDRRLV
jgi:hypothetical protein